MQVQRAHGTDKVHTVTCFLVVLGSSFMAFSDFFVTRESRKKARKLVIASATFDRLGRLMVQTDGTLPLITVEERTLRHSEVLEALDQHSTVFQWLYAVSWDWDMVMPFVTAIARRIFEAEKQEQRAVQRDALTTSQKARRMLSGRYSAASLEMLQHQSSTPLLDFRDKVVDAARRLAGDLDVPLRNLGVFYDHVLPTGTRKAAEVAAAKEAYRRRMDTEMVQPYVHDEERSIASRTTSLFGEGADEEEGATIFVVREVAADQLNLLAKRGYRFTETRFLSAVLADRHAVVKEEMESVLESLRVYAKRGTRPVVQPGGVYAGLFGVRPNPYHRSGGLDVLVYNFARHQIPAYRLPDVASLTEEMKAFLKLIDQMSMDNVMKACEMGSIRSLERQKTITSFLNMQGGTEEEVEQMQLREEVNSLSAMVQFQQALFTALEALHQSVRFFPRILSTARVSSEVLEVPSSLVDDECAPAQIILVQAVLPSEKTLTRASTGQMPAPTDKASVHTPFVFTPYMLFAKSQMMMLQGQSADEFEGEVVTELERRYKANEDGERGNMVETNLFLSDEEAKMSEMMSEKSHASKNDARMSDDQQAPPSRRLQYIARLSRISRPNTARTVTARVDSPTLPLTLADAAPSSPPDAHLAAHANQSLGIRRFTDAGAQGAIPATTSDQTLFVRPPEEHVGHSDDGSNETFGQAKASSDGHVPPARATVAFQPLASGSPTVVRPPVRSASKRTIVQSSTTVAFLPPPDRRPSTANATTTPGPYPFPMQSRRPRTADTTRGTSNFDNWQSRQLEELEKHQPNLLLGILPSEY